MSSYETVVRWCGENAGALGVILAYVVAGVHLTHPKLGLPRLVLFMQADSLHLLASHPRPLVFVASGFAIIIGVPLAATNHYRKPIYVLGIVLMLAYILGYLSWHFSGHGGFLPNREPLFHGMAPLEALTSHFVSDLRARISKLSELALLLVLIVLYRRES
jgi:hypothetical protein